MPVAILWMRKPFWLDVRTRCVLQQNCAKRQRVDRSRALAQIPLMKPTRAGNYQRSPQRWDQCHFLDPHVGRVALRPILGPTCGAGLRIQLFVANVRIE
ncbi:unnamed protein product [Parnassius apollo]|uniref:(apollo) hypothetical protein n=1 Tax=Parnassius apollo TaxID=110799 RepID=A0A8S3WFH4_PARAO|nr:unnamed protein product [Parnassius apollo]